MKKKTLALVLFSSTFTGFVYSVQNDELKTIRSAVSMQQSGTDNAAQTQQNSMQQHNNEQQPGVNDGVVTPEAAPSATALPPAPSPVAVPVPVSSAMVSVEPDALEPLPPPLAEMVEPITPGQVKTLKKKVDSLSRATRVPLVTPVPRISSQTVSLSAGAAIPQVRVFPNVTTTITFSDITGAPWALAAEPANSNEDQMNVKFVEGAPVVYIQPVTDYVSGNVTVFLRGLPTPIIINVTSQNPADTSSTVQVDYRLDLRIPKRSPDTPARKAVATEKIALYDKELQSFLDGVPPEEAKAVQLKNAPQTMRAWMMGDELVIRTDLELRDEFTKTLSAIDGTHVYVLPVTPEVTLSDMGKTRSVYVNLN